MKKSIFLRITAFLCLASSCNIGFCAETTKSKYDEAVTIYLQNHYEKALAAFQELAKKTPDDVHVHHYLALCYQQLLDDKNAAREYEWVLAHSKDQALKEIIQERLERTKRRLSNAGPREEAKPAPLKKHDPVKKVIWFSTNWCSTCKRFTPSWDLAKSKFHTLSFQHLNAEDPANWKEVQKYKPKAYPTLVYLDAKDKVIQNFADAPKPEEFVKQLKELGAP